MALTKVTYPMVQTATFEPIQLVVGNDPAYAGTYDFAELKDAIQYCTGTMLASGKMSSTGQFGQARYQITIPAGTHTFSAMTFRACDLSGIQVWGAGSGSTTIKCKLGGTTSGTWLSGLWTPFADWGGFTLVPGDDVTVITDPAVVCQPWYGGSTPPWSPAQSMVYISLNGCTFGRMFDVHFNASSTGCRLATGVNLTSSLLNFSNLSFTRLRSCMYAYDGSVVSGGDGGITGTNIYEGIVNHQSTVVLRKAVMSGILNGGVPYVGSQFGDCFQGFTTVRDLKLGSSMQGFDRLMFMSGGFYSDETPRTSRSNITKLIERYDIGAPGPAKYAANVIAIDADFLPDDDVLSKDTIMINDATSEGMGVVSYAGDNTAPRVISIPKTVKQVTVRDLTTNISVTCIRNQVATVGGANAVWISASDGITRVYLAMNATGTNYELVWSR